LKIENCKLKIGGSTRRVPPGHHRSGFTLFEILLVLAVMVMILGLAWPVLEKYRGEYRLRQGGLLIQSRLAAARVHAIDTGVPYEFRYEPGGQRFLVLPHDWQALHSQSVPGAHGPSKIAGKLPSAQAEFDPPGPGAAAVQQISADWLTGIAAAAEFTDATWSAPILFYPDGTAARSTVTIRDKKSHTVTVTVSVRPLTGAVTVSKITRGTH
jgi:prepilin-type N-terminal cleavage/methylation domain-containing protein